MRRVRKLEWMDYQIYDYANQLFDERYEEMIRMKAAAAKAQTLENGGSSDIVDANDLGN